MISVHGVGADIASIPRMTRLIAAHGDRFTGRWFTEAERTHCAQHPSPARAFAEVFAAKEAAWKALHAALPPDESAPAPGRAGLADMREDESVRAVWDGSVPWRWIDVTPGRGGRTIARLSGPVAAHAARAGGDGIRIDVAVSSTAAVATAVATAHRPVTPR